MPRGVYDRSKMKKNKAKAETAPKAAKKTAAKAAKKVTVDEVQEIAQEAMKELSAAQADLGPKLQQHVGQAGFADSREWRLRNAISLLTETRSSISHSPGTVNESLVGTIDTLLSKAVTEFGGELFPVAKFEAMGVQVIEAPKEKPTKKEKTNKTVAAEPEVAPAPVFTAPAPVEAPKTNGVAPAPVPAPAPVAAPVAFNPPPQA